MPIFDGLNRCTACGCHVSEPHSPQCPTQCVGHTHDRSYQSRREGSRFAWCAWGYGDPSARCRNHAAVWREEHGEAVGVCVEHYFEAMRLYEEWGVAPDWCGCTNCLNVTENLAPGVQVSNARLNAHATPCAGETYENLFPRNQELACLWCDEGRDYDRTVWLISDEYPVNAWRYHARCAERVLPMSAFADTRLCPCASCTRPAWRRPAPEPAAVPVAAQRVVTLKGRGLVGVAVYL